MSSGAWRYGVIRDRLLEEGPLSCYLKGQQSQAKVRELSSGQKEDKCEAWSAESMAHRGPDDRWSTETEGERIGGDRPRWPAHGPET